jgi:hypothetical protein
MTRLTPHQVKHDPESNYEREHADLIATVYPADNDAVLTILSADPDNPDGRSQFMWVRLVNGDLILGVFPQGDTYFATETSHSEKDLDWGTS